MCLMHKCNYFVLFVLAKIAFLSSPQVAIDFCHSKCPVPSCKFMHTLPIHLFKPIPTMCCAHQLNQSSESWKAFSSKIQSGCVQNTLLEGSVQCRICRICHKVDLHPEVCSFNSKRPQQHHTAPRHQKLSNCHPPNFVPSAPLANLQHSCLFQHVTKHEERRGIQAIRAISHLQASVLPSCFAATSASIRFPRVRR